MNELCSSFDTRDDFNRKSIAEKLIRLLISDDIDISPMVIDGGWGIGKSEFCLKTIDLIKSKYPNEYHVVYIDAFKTDYTGEPVLALLGEIINTCCPEDESRENFINTMGNAAGFLLKTALKTAVSYVVRENAEDLKDEFSEAIKGTSGAIIDNAVSSLLKDQVEAEKNIQILQNTLNEISNNKKIIIFVDELDRCRPDYAIDMLEVIKHVFSIPNIKIVLVTNIEQLKLSISHRYGIAHNSQRYLDKFIKFSLTLPSKKNSRNYYKLDRNSYDYLLLMINKCNLSNYFNFQFGHLENLAIILIKENISLREVESIVRLLKVYVYITDTYTTKEKPSNLVQSIIFFCVFMSVTNPKLIQDFTNYSVNADELATFISLKSKNISQNVKINEILFLLALSHTNTNRESYKLPDFTIPNTHWHNLLENILFEYDFDISHSNPKGQKPFELFNSIINTLSLCSV
ncbi:KAP family P-loop NTPase fold protein [Mannheimia indoligenes]|uniref:KAP family P-loop NTPase fold protein n=1 Tax=Mannheimia indoligenes TaxID=3103145 RepID=UPI002FE55E28